MPSYAGRVKAVRIERTESWALVPELPCPPGAPWDTIAECWPGMGYGDPQANAERIAAAWNATLEVQG